MAQTSTAAALGWPGAGTARPPLVGRAILGIARLPCPDQLACCTGPGSWQIINQRAGQHHRRVLGELEHAAEAAQPRG